MPPLPRPTSQPPTYAEAVSSQAYSHEPAFIVLAPVRRAPEDTPRKRDPPVHDISAGDRLVALADIGIKKAVKALTPSNPKKSDGKEEDGVKSS